MQEFRQQLFGIPVSNFPASYEHNRDRPTCGIRNPSNFCCAIWNLAFGIQNTAQGIRNQVRIGIQNPSSTDAESGFQYLECSIHGMESRV